MNILLWVDFCPSVLQGTQVYVFLTKAAHTLVSGYPKRLEKELGGPHGISLKAVDAAFTCPGSSQLYVTAGESFWGLKEVTCSTTALWHRPLQGRRKG